MVPRLVSVHRPDTSTSIIRGWRLARALPYALSARSEGLGRSSASLKLASHAVQRFEGIPLPRDSPNADCCPIGGRTGKLRIGSAGGTWVCV
jgi:hypothetical protein